MALMVGADIIIMIEVFGAAGFALIKLGFKPAPIFLDFVHGKLMEENLRRSLILSR